MRRSIGSWWKDNWSWFLAATQCIVAVLMLTSLYQNGRMLEQNRQSIAIAQRQLESTITPNVELILTSGGFLFICNRGIAPVAEVRIVAVVSAHLRLPKLATVQEQISGGVTPIAKSIAPGDTLRYPLKDSIFPFNPNPELGLEDVMCCVIQYHRPTDMHAYHKTLMFMRSRWPEVSADVQYWPMRAMVGSSVPINGPWSEFCREIESECLEYMHLKSFD